ncbi:hypothetical protein F5Y18DRAFT_235607 [Xylariaceae sp. FL1019]|nr:hypothetical protein F5Y18DRAFT_235607 [Xylariaceae sp. FL1019]
MAPLTRRRAAKAQQDAQAEISDSDAHSHDVSFDEPIALRSKRKDDRSPASSAKNMKHSQIEVRIEEAASTPTSRRKQIEVQIPSSTFKTTHIRTSPVPDSQEELKSDSDDEPEPPSPPEPTSATKQLQDEAVQKLAKRSQIADVNTETATAAAPQPNAAKSTHVVFGDDEDVDNFVAAAAEPSAKKEPAHDDDDEEDEDSDDDAAPEAVSTAAAAQQNLKSAQAAVEAAEKQEATLKRKRQERNDLFKQQAEQRKRARDTKPSASKMDDISQDEKEPEEEHEQGPDVTKRRRIGGKLPDMLPAELLTDSSEDEEEDGALIKKVVKKPQKKTFETATQALSLEGKRPRDQVVGSTRYRVLAEQSDQRLAPKANKQSLRAKQDLLRRNRQGVTVNKKKGFFVKR